MAELSDEELIVELREAARRREEAHIKKVTEDSQKAVAEALDKQKGK